MTDRKLQHDLFGGSSRKRRKQGKASKEKGNKNELVACSVLSEWTGGWEFVKTFGSGAMAKTVARNWKNQQWVCGDVVCTEPNKNFIFCVETKHLNDEKMFECDAEGNLLKHSKVVKCWLQCMGDARQANKIPLLMLRQQGMAEGTYVVFIDIKNADVMKKRLLLVPSYIWEGEGFGVVGYDSGRFFANDYDLVAKNIKP